MSALTNVQAIREIKKLDPEYEPAPEVDTNRAVLLQKLGYEVGFAPAGGKGRRQARLVPKGQRAEFQPEAPQLPPRQKPEMVSTSIGTEPQVDYKTMFEEERLKNQELGQYVEQQISGLEQGIGSLLVENELLRRRPEMQSMETQTQPLEETKQIEELSRGLQNLSQEVIRNQELQTKLQKAKIEEEISLSQAVEQERRRNQELQRELQIAEFQSRPQQSVNDLLFGYLQKPQKTRHVGEGTEAKLMTETATQDERTFADSGIGTEPILTSDFSVQVENEFKQKLTPKPYKAEFIPTEEFIQAIKSEIPSPEEQIQLALEANKRLEKEIPQVIEKPKIS